MVAFVAGPESSYITGANLLPKAETWGGCRCNFVFHVCRGRRRTIGNGGDQRRFW